MERVQLANPEIMSPPDKARVYLTISVGSRINIAEFSIIVNATGHTSEIQYFQRYERRGISRDSQYFNSNSLRNAAKIVIMEALYSFSITVRDIRHSVLVEFAVSPRIIKP